MKSRERKSLMVAFVVILCACSRREERLFAELKDAPRDSVRARANGLELSRTRKGIDLAVADMDIFGGNTRGWSSWILVASESVDLVEPRLKRLMADSAVASEKRMEAANILWLRTRETSYLDELFRMVQRPGNLEVDWGRRRLSKAFVSDDVKKAITLPASVAIPLSAEKFTELLHDPKNLRVPGDDQ